MKKKNRKMFSFLRPLLFNSFDLNITKYVPAKQVKTTTATEEEEEEQN